MDCVSEQDCRALAERVLEACRQQGFRLAVAESCTGGLIGASLTAVPGASDVFEGGILSYQNRVKEALLGVQAQTLESVGAVSPQCAREMALGACRALGADVALSATGVAGPGGGSAEKPVGTVCIGCAVRGACEVQVCHFSGDRDAVRRETVREALNLALRCLRKEESKHG